jgi:hypothetical protein
MNGKWVVGNCLPEFTGVDMKVTEEFSSSAYHIYLYRALTQAVEEYERVNEKIQASPPLTEETATLELTELYYSREQKRAIVIVLGAGCVEALANLYLAMKTTPEQFEVLERATPIEKWVILPALFVKDYAFAKDSELFQDLRRLFKHRDAWMHLKEEVTQDGKTIHKGKLPERADDEDKFIRRCASLPERLVQHVTRYDLTADVEHLGFTLSFASVWSKVWGGTPNTGAASEG